MKKIIAFTGRAGSGKDYQCNLLKDYKKLSFADALRDIAFSALNIPKNVGTSYYDQLKVQNCIDVEVWSDSRRSKLIYQDDINFRQFLEFLGTQGIRKYDNDFWCRCLVKQINDCNYDKICISDLRFINEYEYLNDFCEQNNYDFKVIFCDYHSDRYQNNNDHESAKMSNYFAENGYKDLQELTFDDMQLFKDSREK